MNLSGTGLPAGLAPLDALGDPVLGVDPDGVVAFGNRAAAALFGRAPEALAGTPLAALLPPEEAAQLVARVRAARTEAPPAATIVARLGTADRRFDVRVDPLPDGATALVVARDVTASQRAEDARRRSDDAVRGSERRLRALLDGVHLLALGLDAEGRAMYCNPHLLATAGWRAEELLGHDALAQLAPPGAASFAEVRALVEREDGAHVCEFTLRTRGGECRAVRWTFLAVRDEDGAFSGVIGLGEDLTQQRLLQHDRALLSAAVAQSPDAVIITETDGTIVYVNPAFESVTGYAAREALGRSPRILQSGEHERGFYAGLWGALHRGETWRGRLVNRRRDGRRYIAEAVISPVADERGRVTHYVGVQRDVTREQALDEQLRQAQKMEALGQLTSGIAHDFNNLLAVVASNAALLRDEAGPSFDRLRPYLHDIENGVRRGAVMIRRLLAFSRCEPLSVAPVDLGNLVIDVAATLRRLVPESITIEVPPVPCAPVLADAGAVEQVLLNLVNNARDAMPAGGRLTLAVALAPEGREVRVIVRDTGIGMDHSTLARVFEPFFTTKPPNRGTGLGMAMVYGLMTQHGGRVEVASEPGQGTTVGLVFPRASSLALPSPAPTPTPSGAPRGRERILVVEDEEPLQRALARVLARHGYEVLLACNGREGLALAEAHDDLALVLSDAVMPEMGGLELYAALRARDIRTPFLLATGYAPADLVKGAAVAVLEKPWTVDALLDAVREALDAPARSSAA